MDDILSEEMGFCAIQLKGQGNDDWEGVKRYIAYQLVISDYYPLTCTPFIRVQVGIVNYLLKSIIEFPPRYTEEPRKFSLRHGNLAFTLVDNLHITPPIKVTAMIVRAIFALWIIACFHAVSSILQVAKSEGSQASLSANRL